MNFILRGIGVFVQIITVSPNTVTEHV